jgi:hypothetical protein
VPPSLAQPTAAEVHALFPTATVVPRNLLRLYVHFSVAMSEGDATRHVRLLDESGESIPAAFLATEDELWDPGRRRLTLLLDPARIKRGLRPNLELGYPLVAGSTVRFVVDAGFRDAQGARLATGAERAYRVGGDERALIDLARWSIDPPAARTMDAVSVRTDRPLDHALLARCVGVVGPDGERVTGGVRIGAGERSWHLTPRLPWQAGAHRLVVDPILEDLAGNSLRRVFDRDLSNPNDQTSTPRTELAFTPG